MLAGGFGQAGAHVIVEEFLKGEIASLFALCDGTTSLLFGGAQDHKPAFDGDKGPNTGGMGTYAPAPVLTDAVVEAARMDGASERTIVYRIIAPMLRPTLVSLFLVSFVFHYNDYFWPLVMTTSASVRTLPLGIALLREQGTGVRWHIVMAGNVVLSAPVLALFAVAQKHLLRAVRG